MANFDVGSLGDYIREQRRTAQISLRQLAEAAGVSNPYLSQIERGLRKPSAEILQQIAKGLRISAEALYVQAGFLTEDGADNGVPTSIRADSVLTERQKQVLLEIYESFRRENRTGADVPSEATGGKRAGEAGKAATSEKAQGDNGAWEAATDDPSTGTAAASAS